MVVRGLANALKKDRNAAAPNLPSQQQGRWSIERHETPSLSV